MPCNRFGYPAAVLFSFQRSNMSSLGCYDILSLPCSEEERETERGGGRGVTRQPTPAGIDRADDDGVQLTSATRKH